MKTKQLILLPAIVMLALAGCKSKKTAATQPTPIEQKTGAVEISLPFSGKEYRSDENFFRARQSGQSPDMATAKKIAFQNAKGEMAGNINAIIKRVTDQYTNQRTVGDKQEFENKFEELAREVVNMQLSNVREMDSKVFQQPDGKYTYWVAIEASKTEVYQKLDERISADAKLKLDYDKMKFQQIFDAEMKKLAEEGR